MGGAAEEGRGTTTSPGLWLAPAMVGQGAGVGTSPAGGKIACV